MMKSPAGRYPFSRFMASPSRAKRSELEHDSPLRRCRIEVANVDGPEPDSGTCCFGRPLILTPAQPMFSPNRRIRHHHPLFKLIPVFSPNSDSLPSLFGQGVGVP